MLARYDGLFVTEIQIDRGQAPFNDRDLDELALAISMYTKELLGHRHDVHRLKNNKRISGLDPTSILIVYPVALEPAFWSPLFDKGEFNDADLRAATCVPPPEAPTEKPRNALIRFRRSFLKVFENTAGRLQVDRDKQIAWGRGLLSKLVLLVYNVVILGVLGLLIVEVPNTSQPASALFSDGILALLALAIVPAATTFWIIFLQFLLWDLPRIRLLRSLQLFYRYANPLNRVIAQTLSDGATSVPVDDFADCIDAAQIKVAGEAHRASVHQFWMTIALSIAGVVFAAFALRGLEIRRESLSLPPAVAVQPGSHVTSVLKQVGAGDEIRTHDPHVGNVMLYP